MLLGRRIGGANWLFKLDGQKRGRWPRLNPFLSGGQRTDRTIQIKTRRAGARFRDSFISNGARVIGEPLDTLASR